MDLVAPPKMNARMREWPYGDGSLEGDLLAQGDHRDLAQPRIFGDDVGNLRSGEHAESPHANRKPR